MKTVCTSCGTAHGAGVEHVVIGRDARSALGEFIDAQGWHNVLTVADANTAEVLADEIGADLSAAGHDVDSHVFATRLGLVADDEALRAVRGSIAAASPDIVLAVGAGTITDVVRYATFLEGINFVSVPTAPSTDCYASSVAALEFDGVPVTLPTQAPLAIFADSSVLAAAPLSMVTSGFGDLAGSASAHFDWALSAGIGGELFCEVVEDAVLKPLLSTVASMRDLVSRDEVAVTALMSGLVAMGQACSYVGSSRPGSGCERLAVLFWDIQAFRGLRPHVAHGLEVGYATRFAMRLQRAAIGHVGEPMLDAAGSGGGRGEQEWFGDQILTLGPVRDEKQMWFARHGDDWPGGASDVASLGDQLGVIASSFNDIERALDVAGVSHDVGALGVDATMMRATWRYANRLRSPFTVLDLLEGQRRLDAVLDEVAGAS